MELRVSGPTWRVEWNPKLAGVTALPHHHSKQSWAGCPLLGMLLGLDFKAWVSGVRALGWEGLEDLLQNGPASQISWANAAL